MALPPKSWTAHDPSFASHRGGGGQGEPGGWPGPGGGVSGSSCATTGFGSKREPAASGGRIATGTTCAMRPGAENVTVKSPVLSGSRSLHGVRQVWPVEVRASAPGGSEASDSSPVPGPNTPGKRSLVDAHPAKVRPDATMTTARFMIPARY